MTERPTISLAVLLLAGMLLAALCTAAGYLALGMGEGWDLPMRYGKLSFIFYPLALARWRWIDRATPWRSDSALTAGVTLPLLLPLALLDVLPHPGRIAASGWLTFVILAGMYWSVGRVLAKRKAQAVWGSGVLLAIGVALDALAVIQASNDYRAGVSGMLAFPWILLWLGWQVFAVLALIRQLRYPERKMLHVDLRRIAHHFCVEAIIILRGYS